MEIIFQLSICDGFLFCKWYGSVRVMCEWSDSVGGCTTRLLMMLSVDLVKYQIQDVAMDVCGVRFVLIQIQ